METIYKYQLEIADVQVISAPSWEPLHIANQDGDLTLWASVDASGGNVSHRIRIVGTGQPLDDDMGSGTYIGTAICGQFVWHVFEV